MLKRSVKIAGHATSITLEDEFWAELKLIACRRKLSINALITEIDAQRTQGKLPQDNLSSAIRIYILQSLKSAG